MNGATLAAVALGGAAGAVARHVAVTLSALALPTPWPTFVVNLVGSFALGVLAEAMALRWSIGPELRAFLTIGLLGGFTTFSTFSLDLMLLLQKDRIGEALAYAGASVLLGVAGLFAGMRLARAVLA